MKLRDRAGVGALESEVLKVVKNHDNCSAADVLDIMKREREIAYTTVSTTLDRLHKKGLLAREPVSGKGRQHYLYRYRADSGLERKIVNRAVDRLVNAFGTSAVSAIYDRLDEIGEQEASDLKGEIESRRKAGGLKENEP